MSTHRAQFMVMLRTTMSTCLSFSTGIRSAALITRNVITLSRSRAVGKIALATALTMSMSKPTRSPVSGSREAILKVSAETPAMSRPRSRISSTVAPSPSSAMLPPGAYDVVALLQVTGGAGDAAGVDGTASGSGIVVAS